MLFYLINRFFNYKFCRNYVFIIIMKFVFIIYKGKVILINIWFKEYIVEKVLVFGEYLKKMM